MQFLLILALGLAPGIFWLWLIYRWDKYQPEPRGLVIRTFLFGIVSVIPVLFVEVLLALPLILANFGDLRGLTVENISRLSTGGMAYFAFIVAGFTEELGKFLVVRLAIYRSPYFNEPTDGIVYAAAAALGFASLENISYLAVYGWETILVRGPISTLAHVLFSMLWGYPLALHKMGWRRGKLLVWLGLLGSMVMHGLFDFLLFTQSWYSWLVLPVFAGMVVLMVIVMRHSRRISSSRHSVVEAQTTCPQCGQKIPFYAGFCTACGAKALEDTDKPQLCGKCGAPLDKAAGYCTACGSRVVRKPWQSPKV